jgi:hypothetical protein
MPTIGHSIEIDDDDLLKELKKLANFKQVLVKSMDEFGKTFMNEMVTKSPVRSGLMKKSYLYSTGIVGDSVMTIVENTAVRSKGTHAPFPYPFAIEHSGWKDKLGRYHPPLLHEQAAIAKASKRMEEVLKSEVKL